MAPPKRPWFRFYTEALTDRKMRRLAPAERWLWVAVLGAARQSPIPGYLLLTERANLTDDDLADLAGMPVPATTKGLGKLDELGMIEWDPDLGAWHVTRWDDRQFESDDTSKRTAKHRSKERSIVVPGNTPETDAEPEPEADSCKPLDDDSPPLPEMGSSSKFWPIFAEAGLVAARCKVPPPKHPDAYATTCARQMQREQEWQLPELLKLRPDLEADASMLAYLIATDGAGKAIQQAKDWAGHDAALDSFDADFALVPPTESPEAPK